MLSFWLYRTFLTFLFLFFLTFPLPAWAYFDPGFGGYLLNSIISFIATGLAFISATLIYFFRTIIGQKLCFLWQNYRKFLITILLFVLGIGGFSLGIFLSHQFFNRTDAHPRYSSHVSITHLLDSKRMFKGYNLYNGKLFDKNGRVIKQWSEDSLGIIDKNGDYYGEKNEAALNHQRPTWGRYTWNDHVIWEKPFLVHHEIYLSPQGTIFVLTLSLHDYNNHQVLFDNIVEYDKNGKQRQCYSFWKHLQDFKPYHSRYLIDTNFPGTSLLSWPNSIGGTEHPLEYFHTNSFFILPPNPLERKNPAFRHGNWLISIFYGSILFILDQDTQKILWHAVGNEIVGSLDGQHSASMLSDGNILVFDNGIHRQTSRILVIDPLTLKIKWQYSAPNFFSHDQGFVQGLPNGNFLVTDSKKGHVFELTADKKIVWDYFDTMMKDGDMYRVTRYPKEMIDRLLQKGGRSELP